MFENYLDSLKRILAIDSVLDYPKDTSPFGDGIKNCLDETLKIAKTLGFRVKSTPYYGWAEIGSGEELFCILGHLDTVPYQSEEWSFSPLGEEHNRILYGRGVVDNKGPILATLFATAELIKSGFIPKKRIRIIFGLDEESGCRCIEKYNQDEEEPTFAFTPDANFPCINCEKGIIHANIKFDLPDLIESMEGGDRFNIVMDKASAIIKKDIKIKNKENISLEKLDDNRVKITARGISSHASKPNKGKNALIILFKYLKEIDKSIEPLYTLLNTTDGKSLNISSYEENSGHLTINWGMVSSEDDKMVLSCDIRYPLSSRCNSIISSLKKSFNTDDIEVIAHKSPLYVPQDSKLVSTLVDVYNEICSEKEKPLYTGGGTYAKYFKNCVAFGPQFSYQENVIHEKDERVSIKDLKKMYKIYYESIKRLGFSD